jgi:hypothetical protein
LFFPSTWGYLAMAYCLGAELLRRAAWEASPLAALFLGLLLFQPLVHVPYLQIPIILVLGGIGLGTVVTTRFGTNEGWSLNPLSEA